jgi:hypothetical protein
MNVPCLRNRKKVCAAGEIDESQDWGEMKSESEHGSP